MSTTSSSLFLRLKQTREQSAWERLVDLFSPLLYMWACRAGLRGPEAADLTRTVFAEFMARLSSLEEKPTGGFRALFRESAERHYATILGQRENDAGHSATLADGTISVPPSANGMWESEYVPFILGRALEFLRDEFDDRDWNLAWAVAVEGRPRDEVAREMDQSAAEVAIAEARVLRRLRQELDGFLD